MISLFSDAVDVEKRLDTFMTDTSSAKRHVIEAAKYSLSAGGKRIRPLLMLEFYKICGGKADVLDFACGIEMIQTYSLIHDDLPALDNDDFRRGKPSCHRAFGEAIAIIAGDALLNGAFELMLSQKGIEPERVLKAAACFADRSGVNGMIGGQSIDLSYDSFDEQSYIELISHKTAALFEGSCAAGAILAGADDETAEAARRFGYYCGLAFQIKDDLMDEENMPNSAATVFGREESEKKMDFYIQKAVHSIEGMNGIGRLLELAEWLKTRNI